jgi:hypothetical protein
MMIEVPATAGVSRRFVPSDSITDISSAPTGGGTYQVSLTSASLGSLVVSTGLTQADADALAEEIATGLGLDWQL